MTVAFEIESDQPSNSADEPSTSTRVSSMEPTSGPDEAGNIDDLEATVFNF